MIWNLKEDETEQMGDAGAKSEGLPSQGLEESGKMDSSFTVADGYYRFLSAVKEMSLLSVGDLLVGIVRVRRSHLELVCALNPMALLP